MKLSRPFPLSAFRFPLWKSRPAFTLIEVMVAVVLMSVIVLGLMAMFSQTQRAFRAGMTQTDVLEGGRMATEMISRELEQIKPAYVNLTNNNAPNFFTFVQNEFAQPLPASNGQRTNIMTDVFFLAQENQTWTGVGYFVRSNLQASTSVAAVGTLYRFELSTNVVEFARHPWLMYFNFTQAIQNNPYVGTVSKILDGVVNFDVRAYNTNGYWIIPFTNNIGQIATNSTWSFDKVNYHFYNASVPAFVEFELGILEQHTYDRYKSIPVYDAQTNFLARQAGRVQVFRQRVAVRNVDRSAYN